MKPTAVALALPSAVQSVLALLVERARPQQVLLFGSRARGDHRENSDFDVAIVGRQCSVDEWNRLMADIEDLPLTLHTVEIVEIERLGEEYRKSIRREGKPLYEQGS